MSTAIYYIEFSAEPIDEAQDLEDVGSATVRCWWQADSSAAAEATVRKVIETDSWRVTACTRAAEITERSDSIAGTEERDCYEQALEHGGCLMFCLVSMGDGIDGPVQ